MEIEYQRALEGSWREGGLGGCDKRGDLPPLRAGAGGRPGGTQGGPSRNTCEPGGGRRAE